MPAVPMSGTTTEAGGTLVKTALGLVLALVAAAVGFVVGGLAVLDGPTLWRQATGHVTIDSVDQGGLSREFRVFRPSAKAGQPGLVIVLHGADASGQQIER